MAQFLDGGELFLVEGDVVTFAVDAIISNDDVDGRMWTTVASAIKLSSGTDVERESVSHGPYRLGTAWLTEAGNLHPMKNIIHVASMDRFGRRGDLQNIRACVRQALLTAVNEGLGSVALGAIGTGTASPTIELDDWLRSVGAEIGRFLAESPEGEAKKRKIAVLLVLYEPDDLDKCAETLKAVIPDQFLIDG